ncbi:hypothetical protein M9458_055239, partial [Cirrhinus mrigala]
NDVVAVPAAVDTPSTSRPQESVPKTVVEISTNVLPTDKHDERENDAVDAERDGSSPADEQPVQIAVTLLQLRGKRLLI